MTGVQDTLKTRQLYLKTRVDVRGYDGGGRVCSTYTLQWPLRLRSSSVYATTVKGWLQAGATLSIVLYLNTLKTCHFKFIVLYICKLVIFRNCSLNQNFR